MYGPSNLVALNNALTVSTKRAATIYAVTANTGVTAVFEGTLDGTNWLAIQAQRTDTGEWVTGVAASETGAYYVPQSAWKSTRLRQTNNVAGPLTVSADVGMFSAPVQTGQGVYRTSPATLTDRQTAQMIVDAIGNLKVSLGTSIAGEDRTNNRLRMYQMHLGGYTLDTAPSTVTMKTGPGLLAAVIVGAGANSAVFQCWDNTVDPGSTTGQILYLDASAARDVYPFYGFTTGLTVKLTGGNAKIQVFLW